MSLQNHTGLSAAVFRQFNLTGTLNGVVAVRGTFDLLADGRLSRSPQQQPFLWADLYEGDPHHSLLVGPSDFVPFKPGTDVTVLGTTFAPEGRPHQQWTCGIRVAGRLEKLLEIHGPRVWEPQIRPARISLRGAEAEPQFEGWRLGTSEPVISVPLSWVHAFGGPRPIRPTQDTPPEMHPFNGLGPGVLDLNFSPKDRKLPAPQIEATDAPIIDWRQDYVPQGCAPVPPWSRFRQRHVGTVDDDWIRERHPILPRDFDYRFYQSAHPDLVIDPWLRGDEVVEFAHMHPTIRILRVKLPAAGLTATVRRPEVAEEVCPLMLDGVHADLRTLDAKVVLTWRTSFAYEIEQGEIDLRAFRFSDLDRTAAGLPVKETTRAR